MAQSGWRPPHRALVSRRLALAAALWGAAMLAAPRADADARRAKAHAKSKTAAARACAAPKEEPLPVAGAKLAVFAFSGDDAEPVRRQVLHVLRSKGLKLMTSLRPVDSAEQYREMAVTLSLAAYVDGEVEIDGAEASATIFIRSGSTGLRVASVTVSGARRQLPADLGKQLWEQVGAALGHACADAAKPRKPEHEPMRIEAGTPLTNGPSEAD
jgi:hypothetical protein